MVVIYTRFAWQSLLYHKQSLWSFIYTRFAWQSLLYHKQSLWSLSTHASRGSLYYNIKKEEKLPLSLFLKKIAYEYLKVITITFL